jgi:hypothetical protein
VKRADIWPAGTRQQATGRTFGELSGGAESPTVRWKKAAFAGNLIARRPGGNDARRLRAVVRVKDPVNRTLHADIAVAKMG